MHKHGEEYNALARGRVHTAVAKGFLVKLAEVAVPQAGENAHTYSLSTEDFTRLFASCLAEFQISEVHRSTGTAFAVSSLASMVAEREAGDSDSSDDDATVRRVDSHMTLVDAADPAGTLAYIAELKANILRLDRQNNESLSLIITSYSDLYRANSEHFNMPASPTAALLRVDAIPGSDVAALSAIQTQLKQFNMMLTHFKVCLRAVSQHLHLRRTSTVRRHVSKMVTAPGIALAVQKAFPDAGIITGVPAILNIGLTRPEAASFRDACQTHPVCYVLRAIKDTHQTHTHVESYLGRFLPQEAAAYARVDAASTIRRLASTGSQVSTSLPTPLPKDASVKTKSSKHFAGIILTLAEAVEEEFQICTVDKRTGESVFHDPNDFSVMPCDLSRKDKKTIMRPNEGGQLCTYINVTQLYTKSSRQLTALLTHDVGMAPSVSHQQAGMMIYYMSDGQAAFMLIPQQAMRSQYRADGYLEMTTDAQPWLIEMRGSRAEDAITEAPSWYTDKHIETFGNYNPEQEWVVCTYFDGKALRRTDRPEPNVMIHRFDPKTNYAQPYGPDIDVLTAGYDPKALDYPTLQGAAKLDPPLRPGTGSMLINISDRTNRQLYGFSTAPTAAMLMAANRHIARRIGRGSIAHGDDVWNPGVPGESPAPALVFLPRANTLGSPFENCIYCPTPQILAFTLLQVAEAGYRVYASPHWMLYHTDFITLLAHPNVVSLPVDHTGSNQPAYAENRVYESVELASQAVQRAQESNSARLSRQALHACREASAILTDEMTLIQQQLDKTKKSKDPLVQRAWQSVYDRMDYLHRAHIETLSKQAKAIHKTRSTGSRFAAWLSEKCCCCCGGTAMPTIAAKKKTIVRVKPASKTDTMKMTSMLGEVDGHLLAGGMASMLESKHLQAVITGSKRTYAKDQLKQKATAFGFTYQNIAEDGHCLFRAIGDALTHAQKASYINRVTGAEDIAAALRALAVTHIQRNTPHYVPFVAEGSSLLQHCDGIRTGAWGGSLEVHALSRILGRTIIILDSHHNTPIILKQASTRPPIVLAYTYLAHYDSMRVPAGTALPAALTAALGQHDVDDFSGQRGLPVAARLPAHGRVMRSAAAAAASGTAAHYHVAVTPKKQRASKATAKVVPESATTASA